MIPQYQYFIKGSGTSYCLLTGKIQDQDHFIPLKLPFTPISIKLSGLFAIALSEENEVYGWGLFDKTAIEKPINLKPNTKIKEISCGWEHALLGSDSCLYGIGDNKFGQLGNPNRKYMNEVTVVEEANFVCFRAGFRQSYWVTNDGIRCCGESKNYQLGTSNKKQIIPISSVLSPTQSIKKIECGKKFALFLNKKKQVFALGSNDQKCLIVEEPAIKQLTLIKSNVDDVQCGWSHTVFLTNGVVETYGRNNFSQLGRTNEEKFVNFEEQIEKIRSGTQFSFGIGKSKKLYGWGWNQHNNIIEAGETINQPVQVPVPEGTRVEDCEVYPAITIIKTIKQ